MSLQTVTDENFEEEVLKSDVPVIVDFWAEWCVPCKMIHPILEEIAEAYEGKLKVVKVNVDEDGDIASSYNIISIPTLLLFKDGTVVNQQVGAGSRKAIEDLFKDYI
ncbi:MAG: thioredoxin [Spirochaetia bacterium]